MNRRGFLGALATAFVLDPERLLWQPGKKLISIPSSRNLYIAHYQKGFLYVGCYEGCDLGMGSSEITQIVTDYGLAALRRNHHSVYAEKIDPSGPQGFRYENFPIYKTYEELKAGL